MPRITSAFARCAPHIPQGHAILLLHSKVTLLSLPQVDLALHIFMDFVIDIGEQECQRRNARHLLSRQSVMQWRGMARLVAAFVLSASVEMGSRETLSLVTASLVIMASWQGYSQLGSPMHNGNMM